jgi:hypothetical protein
MKALDMAHFYNFNWLMLGDYFFVIQVSVERLWYSPSAGDLSTPLY